MMSMKYRVARQKERQHETRTVHWVGGRGLGGSAMGGVGGGREFRGAGGSGRDGGSGRTSRTGDGAEVVFPVWR